MLTTITIVMILINLFIFNRTIRTILEVQEHQYNINKDLKNNIEVLDKRTAQTIEIINKYLKEENRIFEMISNFGKEE